MSIADNKKKITSKKTCSNALYLHDAKIYVECKRLYVEQLKAFPEISKLSGVSIPTLYDWASKHFWREERKVLMEEAVTLHRSIYSLISGYVKVLDNDLKTEGKISTQKIFSVGTLINSLAPLKQYEEETDINKIKEVGSVVPQAVMDELEQKLFGYHRKRILPPLPD